MQRMNRGLVLCFAILATFPLSLAQADKGGVPRNKVVYPLSGFTKTEGPFPTDFLTVADAAQNTCERVSLPRPTDCAVNVSECVEIDLLGELDGFNLRPRLSIPFSGPIDPHSVESSTVFLVSLGDALVDGVPSCAPAASGEDEDAPLPAGAGFIAGIEQVVWDPATTTLFVKTDQALEQHTRYALLVTRGVRDASGHSVGRSKELTRAIGDDVEDETATLDRNVLAYERWLRAAVAIARRAGIRRHDIAGASVFTTMSATAVMEKLRDQVNAGPPSAVDFGIGPGGAPAVFDLSAIANITYHQQQRVDLTRSDAFVDVSLRTTRLPLLKIYPAAIGRVAYGRYRSPNYQKPDGLLDPFPTFAGTPVKQLVRDTGQEFEDEYINIFVPSGTRPANGWPVVIFGHGSGDNINGAVFNVAATFAKWGIATIGFNEAGCGFGPESSVIVALANGSAATFPVGGNAIDVNGDGKYDVCEGSGVATGPKRLLTGRDGYRQTIAALVQLVRALQAGVHLDGGATADLDASRIFYTGLSAGATIGAMLAAIEPRVRATAVASAGGWPSPALVPANRGLVGDFLASRAPPLLNPPGTPVVMLLGGLAVLPPFFNEDLPLPGASSPPSSDPVINNIAGALPIQEILDRHEWLNTSTAPAAYAPHLRLRPLAGVPARPFLLEMPRGDQSIANPGTLETIRNGQLADRVVLYRHDLFAQRANFKNPHALLIRTDNAFMKDVALLAQQEIAAFFASDGTADLRSIDPDGACQAVDGAGCLFESPATAIPEGYGFVL